jgi:hypothetical protein
MKNKNGNLGDTDGFSDVGEVDMFGLDEFGEPAGGDSMWGAVIGGGIGTGVAIITRAMTKTPASKLHNYSEAVGLVAGSIAGGVLMAFPGSRRMGLAAIATAFVTNGLRQLEQSLFPPTIATPASPETPLTKEGLGRASGGWGGVTIDPTAVIQPGQGFGIATIEPGYAVQGGFGAPVIDRAYPVPGSIHGASNGFGGTRPELVGPPTLVGAGDYGMSDNPGAQQAKLLGGPNYSAMGAHFGATLFGHNN